MSSPRCLCPSRKCSADITTSYCPSKRTYQQAWCSPGLRTEHSLRAPNRNTHHKSSSGMKFGMFAPYPGIASDTEAVGVRPSPYSIESCRLERS